MAYYSHSFPCRAFGKIIVEFDTIGVYFDLASTDHGVRVQLQIGVKACLPNYYFSFTLGGEEFCKIRVPVSAVLPLFKRCDRTFHKFLIR